MAANKALQNTDANSSSTAGSSAEQLRRISNLLALLAVKGETPEEKILTLAAAGFTTREIAELIRTTANTVAVTKSTSKSKPKKKAARKRAKTR